jgi:hypothetical protein
MAFELVGALLDVGENSQTLQLLNIGGDARWVSKQRPIGHLPASSIRFLSLAVKSPLTAAVLAPMAVAVLDQVRALTLKCVPEDIAQFRKYVVVLSSFTFFLFQIYFFRRFSIRGDRFILGLRGIGIPSIFQSRIPIPKIVEIPIPIPRVNPVGIGIENALDRMTLDFRLFVRNSGKNQFFQK